jgi:Zn-dependent peptidase ImmA (M78 family)
LEVTELCRKLGEQRGRPIRLVEHPIPVPGPFGVWIATETADYVLYQQHTSRSHQDHIVLHEIGHMIAGHRGEEQDNEIIEGLLPGAEPGAARKAVPTLMSRTSYDDEHELEAETVATIILEWASVLDRVVGRASADATAAKMGTALGDRLGWL